MRARWLRCLGGFLMLAVSMGASAQGKPQNPYGPYAFLIGDWNVSSAAGGPPSAVMRFKWGPGQSYIWVTTSLVEGGAEKPHFEGMLMWNGLHKNLDMLFVIDLNYGLMQEHGTVSVQNDGTVVRDVQVVRDPGIVKDPGDVESHSMQTFKATGPDSMITTIMRETPQGWVPGFPGSDHLVMTRRTDR